MRRLILGVAHLVTGNEAVAVRKAIAYRYGITYKLFRFTTRSVRC
ncbi:hypothetical protein EMGBS4_16820 [Acidimicrobiaceae bacterium]|nr:hypothetical protein EMGBS4_16820 [Acidimicrobiaceae bacterium]